MIDNIVYKENILDERLIQYLWHKVQHEFHYPIIEKLVLTKTASGGMYDNSTNIISIDTEFLQKLADTKLCTIEEAFIALSSHEAMHGRFPNSHLVKVLISYFINSNLQNESYSLRRLAENTFHDIIVDIICIKNSFVCLPMIDSLKATLSTIENDFAREVYTMIWLFIQYHCDIKLEATNFQKALLETMHLFDINKIIDNNDIKEIKLAVQIWANIILKIQKQHPPIEEKDIIPFININKESNIKNVENALNELMSKMSDYSLNEYLELVNDINQTVQKNENKNRTTIDPRFLREYYKSLSNKYNIKVSKRKNETTEQVIDFTGPTEKFRTNCDPNLLVRTSTSKLMPGISRSFRRIIRHKDNNFDDNISDLLVLVDSSGSMVNPKLEESTIIIAAMSICRTYLKQRSRIGVINFSDKTLFLPYTRVENNIIDALLCHQGEETTLDLNILNFMLGKDDKNNESLSQNLLLKKESYVYKWDENSINPKKLDIILFSDMEIYNRVDLMDLLEERTNINRVTVISNEDIIFKEDRPNIYYYGNIRQAEDIIRICVSGLMNDSNHK